MYLFCACTCFDEDGGVGSSSNLLLFVVFVFSSMTNNLYGENKNKNVYIVGGDFYIRFSIHIALLSHKTHTFRNLK